MKRERDSHDEKPSGMIDKIMGSISIALLVILGAICAVFMPRGLKRQKHDTKMITP